MNEELKPCPCGGKMELLNDQRHMQQRVSRERFELVCADCGLTVKHPSKSTHKLIHLWNARQPDTGPVLAGMPEVKEKLLEQYKRLVDVERNETGHGSTTFGEYLDMIKVIGMADFNNKLMERE